MKQPYGNRRRDQATRPLARAVVEAMEGRLMFAIEQFPSATVTITVTTAADSGKGSLRAAIEQASELSPGQRASIGFDSGISVIKPLSPLVISRPMTIAGRVEIDGSLGAESDCGFVLFASDVVLSGLALTNWGSAGVLVGDRDARLVDLFVGVRHDGVTAAGNKGAGILVQGGTANIGSFDPNYRFDSDSNAISELGGCIIANNLGAGITVTGDSAAARVYRGSFYNNGKGPLDLNNDGPTPNDPLDADAGPNGLVNTPVINAITPSDTGTLVDLTFEGRAGASFTVVFYVSSPTDTEGSGRTPTFSAAFTLPADGSNRLTADVPFRFLGGGRVTAIATQLNGAGGVGSSEMSEGFDVEAAPPVAPASVSAAVRAGASSFDASVTLTDPSGVFRGIGLPDSVSTVAATRGSTTFVGQLLSQSASGNSRTFNFRFSRDAVPVLSAEDAGTYTIDLGSLANDGFGNRAVQGVPLALTVNESTPPTVSLAPGFSASNITYADSFIELPFIVADTSGVDTTSFPTSLAVTTDPSTGRTYSAVLQQVSPVGSDNTSATVVYRIAASGVRFIPDESGTYNVSLPAGFARDLVGNTSEASTSSILLSIAPDTLPPAVTLLPVATVVSPVGFIDITLGIGDSGGLDASTLSQAISVTSTSGLNYTATRRGDLPAFGVTDAAITYRVSGSSVFSSADNGTFTVSIPQGYAKDVALNVNSAGVAGTFVVNIPGTNPGGDKAPPVIFLPMPASVTSAVAFVDFPITLTDPSGVLTSSLRGKSLRLQSGSTTRTVRLQSITPATGSANEVVATFRLASSRRGANLDHTFNGTYTLRANADLARDTRGNRTDAREFGSLTINIPAPAYDLAVTTLTQSGFRVVQGKLTNDRTYKVPVTLSNLGPGTFSNTAVRIDLLLSPTAEFSSDTAVPVGTFETARLTIAPGKTRTVEVVFSPAGASASGLLVVRATPVGGTGAVETELTNNTFVRPLPTLEFGPRLIDFAVTGLDVGSVSLQRSMKLRPGIQYLGNVYPVLAFQVGSTPKFTGRWTAIARPVDPGSGADSYNLATGSFSQLPSRPAFNTSTNRIRDTFFARPSEVPYEMVITIEYPGDANPGNNEIVLGPIIASRRPLR